MDTISSLWNRLEIWARTNAPEILEDLNAGASDEEIAALERSLQVTLPTSYKESLRIHNGESDGWPCKIFADRGAYLSTEGVLKEWNMRREFGEGSELEGTQEELVRDGIIEVSGPVQAKMFLPAWIPFLECNGDVFWAIDFSPAEGGASGQIIEVHWESCSWRVVADSFQALLDEYVSALERGDYTIQNGRPTLSPY